MRGVCINSANLHLALAITNFVVRKLAMRSAKDMNNDENPVNLYQIECTT